MDPRDPDDEPPFVLDPAEHAELLEVVLTDLEREGVDVR